MGPTAPNDPLTLLLLSLLALGAAVLAAEMLHTRIGVAAATTRRLVHLATGLYVVILPYLFQSVGPILLLSVIFVVVNGVSAARGWLRGMHPEGRASAGTVAFPLALMLLAPFTWTPERVFALQTGFLILAVADPLAAMVGERWPVRAGRVGTARKSLGGSAAFIVAAAFLSAAGVWGFAGGGVREGSILEAAVVALVVAIVAAGAEALGGRGWDNLSVPVAVVVVLLLWRDDPDRLAWMAGGVVLGACFALLAWRLRFLTTSGSIAGGLFAATLVGIGGAEWIAPGLAFFFLSSALSRWSGRIRRRRPGAEEVDGSRRDAGQVFANGGVAWMLIGAHAFTPSAALYWGFVASLAAAAADTWATEIGPLTRQRPRMIGSWRPVPAGTSGAVTLAGTLAGLLGAATVWVAAWVAAPEAVREVGLWVSVAAVIGGGAAGSIADSIAGATIQAIYRERESGRLLDGRVARGGGAVRVRGVPGLNNDVVNVICTAAGAAVAMLAVGA